MSLSLEDVRRIALLARIRIEDSELETLRIELNNIIGWVEQLSQVDTDGVEPMTSVANIAIAQRTDFGTDGSASEEVLANAPDREGDFYAVPKVVE